MGDAMRGRAFAVPSAPKLPAVRVCRRTAAVVLLAEIEKCMPRLLPCRLFRRR